MKFSQIGRITKATALSLAIGLGMTACSSDYTIDFLYVTSSRALSTTNPDGNISSYKIDNESGSLTQIVNSPQDSGGVNPVAVVLSPNSQALYVINNINSKIVEFLIGTDGKIYPKNTYDLGPTATEGSLPTAAVVDPSNKYLIVTFTYQHGFTTASPGPGGFTIFAINSDNSLNSTPIANGSLPYFPVGNNPVSVGVAPQPAAWRSNTIYTVGQLIFDGTNVEKVFVAGTSGNGQPTWSTTPGATTNTASVTTDGSVKWQNVSPVYDYIYVVDQEPIPTPGAILGFNLTTVSGAPVVTSLPGSIGTIGYAAGTQPFAIAEDPTARFVYVTDESANQLIGYTVQADGSLLHMVNGPFATAQRPQGIVVDPRGKYLYLTNFNSSTVNGYAIDTATGTPSGVLSNGATTTGTGPTCVTIEPAQGIYLYTSNFQDNSISGLQMDPHTGALAGIQNTPFNTAGQPTCAVTVAAGSHAFQAVQP